ncbi:hypothetical protein J5N97_012172 [Dioscorea zingiberensis]|uniref:EF-hand domain-containing protein n=1 Tax=Dioscorea zingiberensis TaxID=325984 RepID=A0A9D5HHK7_9LILI|nr:hypothetical protein J5N97_012172 [Dioscorea zingiberensis]
MKVISFPTLFASFENKLSNKTKKKKKNPKSPRSISRADASSSSTSSSSEDSSVSSIHRSSTPKTVLPESPSSDLFDRDKITMSDLETVLRRLGHSSVSDQELSLMLAEVDQLADDGCVTLDALAPKPSGPGDLRDAFAVFDADGDGRISAEELLGIFLALGDDACTLDHCRRMIGAVDSDGDGFVCFHDFVRMMDSQRC